MNFDGPRENLHSRRFFLFGRVFPVHSRQKTRPRKKNDENRRDETETKLKKEKTNSVREIFTKEVFHRDENRFVFRMSFANQKTRVKMQRSVREKPN